MKTECYSGCYISSGYIRCYNWGKEQPVVRFYAHKLESCFYYNREVYKLWNTASIHSA